MTPLLSTRNVRFPEFVPTRCLSGYGPKSDNSPAEALGAPAIGPIIGIDAKAPLALMQCIAACSVNHPGVLVPVMFLNALPDRRSRSICWGVARNLLSAAT